MIVKQIIPTLRSSVLDATGECSVTVTPPTTTDNCVGTVTGTTTDPLTYNTQGTFVVHWSFDDGHDNISTGNQNVNVKDVNKLVALTQNNVTGECSVMV